MAKAPKRVRILVDASLDQTQFDHWRSQGHEVDVIDCSNVDMIVGPKCWRLVPEMLKKSIFDLVMRAARKLRYG